MKLRCCSRTLLDFIGRFHVVFRCQPFSKQSFPKCIEMDFFHFFPFKSNFINSTLTRVVLSYFSNHKRLRMSRIRPVLNKFHSKCSSISVLSYDINSKYHKKCPFRTNCWVGDIWNNQNDTFLWWPWSQVIDIISFCGLQKSWQWVLRVMKPRGKAPNMPKYSSAN